MVERNPKLDSGGRASRQEEYNALRAEGILPADIGASWRLDQAGADLHERICAHLAQRQGLSVEVVREGIPRELVVNLAIRLHEGVRQGLELGLALAGVDDAAAPFWVSSPFRNLAEVRRERRMNDPAQHGPLDTAGHRQIDLAPLCEKLLARSVGALQRTRVTIEDVLDTPLIEGRGGTVESIRSFCTREAQRRAQRSSVEYSEELIESMFDMVESPDSRVKSMIELSFRCARRGDRSVALELKDRVPDELLVQSLLGEALDLRSLSIQTKFAIVEIAKISVAGENLLEVLDGMWDGDIFSPTERYRGRTLAGKEVAQRAIAERVTHDIEVQRRVAEQLLYDFIKPQEYAEMSSIERTRRKGDIENTLRSRVELRRGLLSKIEKLGAPEVVHRPAHELLEQARYELRCFRLFRNKL